MSKKNLLHLLCLFFPLTLTQSSHLTPRKSTSAYTYDAHIICDSPGPSHAEGLPLAYSEIVYKELLSLCSAAHGARQNVGCFCPTSSGSVHCDRNLADSNLWAARYFPDNNPANDALSQIFERFGYPHGNVPFPLFCSSVCECKTERGADAWYQEHFEGVDVDGFVGRNGLLQPSSQPSGSSSSEGDPGAAEQMMGNNHAAAGQLSWQNQCGKNCTSSKDCTVPAGQNGTCSCQAHSSQYQPGPGTVAFAAACLVFLGSGRKREEGLPCPCNSTYVSHGCCDNLEGTVWESPDMKLGELVMSVEHDLRIDKTPTRLETSSSELEKDFYLD